MDHRPSYPRRSTTTAVPSSSPSSDPRRRSGAAAANESRGGNGNGSGHSGSTTARHPGDAVTTPTTTVPARGSHNRPWEAEHEYLALRRQQRAASTSTAASSSNNSSNNHGGAVESSYSRYLESKQAAASARPRNVVEEVAASLKYREMTTEGNPHHHLHGSSGSSSRSKQPPPDADSGGGGGAGSAYLRGESKLSSSDSKLSSPNDARLSSRELRTRRLRQQQEEREASWSSSSSGAFRSSIASSALSLQPNPGHAATTTTAAAAGGGGSMRRLSSLEESASRREQLATRVRESSSSSSAAAAANAAAAYLASTLTDPNKITSISSTAAKPATASAAAAAYLASTLKDPKGNNNSGTTASANPAASAAAAFLASTLADSKSRGSTASRVRSAGTAAALGGGHAAASSLLLSSSASSRQPMGSGGLAMATPPSASMSRREAATATGGIMTSHRHPGGASGDPSTGGSGSGWSTLSAGHRNRASALASSSSGAAATNASSVDRFLGQRTEPGVSGSVARLALSTTLESAPNLNVLRSKVTDSFDDDESTTDEEDDANSADVASTDGNGNRCDDGPSEWSVHVAVVSGVDFPAPVVPNLPLSPVLRLGLVPLEDREKAAGGELQSISKARVRTTTAKILAKKDNGSLEFHEEFRWDHIRSPERLALIVQLDSKAVLTPQNSKESPLAVQLPSPASAATRPGAFGARPQPISSTSGRTTSSSEDATGTTGIGSLFRRPTKKTASEMETANAAAAVAKLLVEGSAAGDNAASAPSGPLFDSKASNLRALSSNQSEVDVRLRPRKRLRNKKLTQDLFLGSHAIPLTALPLGKAMKSGEPARMEQWFELTTKQGQSTVSTSGSHSTKRNPSVLLEITFSSSEARDESEDEMDCDGGVRLHASFAKRTSQQIRSQQKDIFVEDEKKSDEEPELVPGVIDYVCVVGARDIGDQKFDDGSSGWVNSTPECCVLEQYPEDHFHAENGRTCVLPNKVEWFCFPEGCRLWRGATPPNLDELNFKRFSASSPANISTSIASFDACLGCTTSFSWFVISSHTEEYGSESAKTFGAVIRFFVPAPPGIDSTQDDFAQTFIEGPPSEAGDIPEGKRLWVPIGICLTSSLPVIGTMEAMLLRLCEALVAKGISAGSSNCLVRDELANLICFYQRPIPGVVQCSVPFLRGENFHITLPPPDGMPALPHGNAVASVCRLLGADGFTYMLAAVLTECKIIIHSSDIANLCLVSEVMLALIYPFAWTLPYIPVLPVEMMEFIEAPLSYFLGVPSCNMKQIDPLLLEDVVVVDLDRDFASSEFYDGPSVMIPKSKTPTPLPATVAGNISRAVYRLLRAEENEEEEASYNSGFGRSFPRMEPESKAEREFRISVAIEVCSLVRGYQDCLVFASSSQPVFNVDKFLQVAPALFEEQRGTSDESGNDFSHYVLSPRSRRFMSLLVNCQHFHQFLEILDSQKASFFHEVLSTVHTDEVGRRLPKRSQHVLAIDFLKCVESLGDFLQKLENKIPSYRAQRLVMSKDFDEQISSLDGEEKKIGARFPRDLLQQIVLSSLESSAVSPPGSPGHGEGVKQVSVEYLMELENNPWRYQRLFGNERSDFPSSVISKARVKLRDAIGERRYRAWKLEIEQEKFDCDETSVTSDDLRSSDGSMSIDLDGILTSTAVADRNDTALDRRFADAKDRESLRKCLEWAFTARNDMSKAKGMELLYEAELALRNSSARKFLLTVLSQRSDQAGGSPEAKGRRKSFLGSSKLDFDMFNILMRLGYAMLDACQETSDYDSAYSVLTLTAGIYMITGENDHDVAVAYMTEQLALHLIFSDLEVWNRVTELHLKSRKEGKELGNTQDAEECDDEYEAVVATLYEMLGYGIPSEEMARFASHVSESRGWFSSERGQTVMLLAKRLSSRREQGGGVGVSSPAKRSDLELMVPLFPPSKTVKGVFVNNKSAGIQRGSASSIDEQPLQWIETSWCHPAAQSSRRLAVNENARRPGTQSLLNMLDEHKALPDSKRQNPKLMKRSAVTSMAHVGASIVITGGLDGGVFVARRVRSSESENSTSSEESKTTSFCVRGVHLDWGSSGSRYTVASNSSYLDGEYGVGAVSCLAATSSNLSAFGGLESSQTMRDTRDCAQPLSEEDLLDALDGCRVVAGTTCGDLRVWTLKDVYSAVFYSNGDHPTQTPSATNDGLNARSTSQKSPARVSGSTNFSAGSSITRLKFSLRGRALSGHRGGVSCIDVPARIYRPDCIVSGGADGLIKLWNLRAPGSAGSRRAELDTASPRQSPSNDKMSPRAKAAANGDALCILSGHGGRILCVKSAWHGDRLLSGGADRTVRLWDIAGSGGKCLVSMSGHLGWVTHVRYWGPNTIVSASTDRSVLLWDARVRSRPLFSLRHHHAPVSDILVGARTDPMVFSASSDGSVAAWDFRLLGQTSNTARVDGDNFLKSKSVSIRSPPYSMHLDSYSSRRLVNGPVLLCRGVRLDRSTVLNVGTDCVVREWDYTRDNVISEHATGHCDLVSSFTPIYKGQAIDWSLDCSPEQSALGTVTTSWDGTVRLRTLVRS